VLEESFNLILQLSSEVKKIEEELSANIPEIEVFSIRHKRNGEHKVFQFRKEAPLSEFL